MELVDDGVRVVLTIEPGADPIPADAEAVVATRSAVGEQYVDLRPQSDGGPFLEDGAVIPQSRTDIPVPVEQMLLNIDGLVGSIDQENLRIVVDELGRAFDGAGDDLGRLIDNGDLLLARAEESLPQTLRLITDGQTVLETQVASRSAIRAVGGGPAAGDRHVRRPRPRAARHPGQRARRGRGPGGPDRATPGPGWVAGAQPRHPERGADPAAGRHRAAARHLPGRGLGRLHRRPARRATAQLRSHFGFVLERRRPAPVHHGLRAHRQHPERGRGRRAGHRRAWSAG